MEAARVLPMSSADYLVFEEKSDVRHEFVGGEIHAMADESLAHNTIAGNIFASLRGKLRGGPCRVLVENVKVQLSLAQEDIFYYPDVLVTCHPTELAARVVLHPTLIVEVLSPSTENIDRREKKLSYLQSPTLEEYILVTQDRREVIIFRRATGWEGETYTAAEAVIELRSVKQALSLAEIYEDVF
ncbi:MAG: Uma2 family endonuclease [Verrucomicrobia bacterium]|nr:Uma2 family endonuclease [Verrucomicrobiota bacterium]